MTEVFESNKSPHLPEISRNCNIWWGKVSIIGKHLFTTYTVTPVYPNGSLFPIRFVASFSSSFLDSILVSGLLGMKHESSGNWHGYDITLSYNSSLTWKKPATVGYLRDDSPYHWVFFHGWIKSLDSPSFQWGRTLTPLPQWDDNYFTKHISIHPLGRERWPTLPQKSL